MAGAICAVAENSVAAYSELPMISEKAMNSSIS
jgi:hypothetical protein